jgi:hypothetical protein
MNSVFCNPESWTEMSSDVTLPLLFSTSRVIVKLWPFAYAPRSISTGFAGCFKLWFVLKSCSGKLGSFNVPYHHMT